MTVCPRDGALLCYEDLEFLLDAAQEGMERHRYVGVCGHSWYDPPAAPPRRSSPNRDRICTRCLRPILLPRSRLQRLHVECSQCTCKVPRGTPHRPHCRRYSRLTAAS